MLEQGIMNLVKKADAKPDKKLPTEDNLLDPEKVEKDGGDVNNFVSERPLAFFGMADFKSMRFDLIETYFAD